jgi:hypothetical protein
VLEMSWCARALVVGSLAVFGLPTVSGAAMAEDGNPYAWKASTEQIDRPPTCISG